VRYAPDTDGTVRVDRLTPSGRVYVTELRTEGRVLLRLPGLEGRTAGSDGEVVPHGEMVERWIAVLMAELAPVVHVLDDLRYVEPVLRVDPAGRVVATLHSNHTEPGTTHAHAYARLALDHHDRLTVVTLTRQQLGDLQALYGRDAPILLAPHAVAPRGERRRPRAWLRDLVRRPPTVVVATRLVGVKRLDHLLRAFALVQARVPRARLVIWGDGTEAEPLQALSKELGLRKVRFAGHTTEPVAALRRAQASASTSEREGFGLATAEALASGVPVVAYDYRYGPRDLIRPGVNGYLVPDGDVAALADRLAHLLEHPRRARLMGAAATTVRRRFSVRRHRRAWLRAIDRTRVRP
jgi:poly(glycerol-phosphate) alpha-glucosyltransferase